MTFIAKIIIIIIIIIHAEKNHKPTSEFQTQKISPHETAAGRKSFQTSAEGLKSNSKSFLVL